MIFVTVGTHEQPFNRLIKKVDELIGDGKITENVFMQTGYSTYEPKNCEWSPFLSYSEMNDSMDKSNIVISHGGPSTFMHALSLGKKTIVVPRLEKFHEHINNHQLIFANEVKKRGYQIVVVEDIKALSAEIKNDVNKENLSESNNYIFVKELSRLIKRL